MGGVFFRCSRQQPSDYASGLEVWESKQLSDCVQYSRSSVREAEVPGSLIPEGYTMPILFLWSPDSRPRETESSPSPPERGLPVSWPAAAARPSVPQGSCAHHLLSPLRPGLWPCPSLERSSFPPPPGWARRETRQLLLAKLSSTLLMLGWASAKPQRDLL